MLPSASGNGPPSQPSPDGQAFTANVFPAPSWVGRGGAVTPPTSRGQHPPLLAAEQAARGTWLCSLVSLLGRRRQAVACRDQALGPSGAAGTEAAWLRGRLESLGAGARGARGSRAGRASRGGTAPWHGRCGRGGGGSAT